MTWIDDDRLTRDEINAGAPCRGCGRPFFGGPDRVALLHESPEQRIAREAEDAAFRALHPDCHAGGWTLRDGGVRHCSRCCAPPPIPEDALEKIAAIIVHSAQAHAELEKRWMNAKRVATEQENAPSARVAAESKDLADLRRRAHAAGFDLVPRNRRK